MSTSSGGSAKAGSRARTLAQVYRRFAEVDAAKISPLYGRIATALSESDEALRVIESAPARRRHPSVILAALHDLALSGHAPALAAAFAASTTTSPPDRADTALGDGPQDRGNKALGDRPQDRGNKALGDRPQDRGDTAPGDGPPADPSAVGELAVRVLVELPELVVARASERVVRAAEDGRHAVLYPAIAEVARRVGAGAVGLIDVGRSAGLNLTVDRVGIAYSDDRFLGDPASAVQVSASVKHAGSVPSVPMPEVVARVAVGGDLVDVTDADETRWLRACVPPDQVARLARIGAEVDLVAADPPVLLPGEIVDVLPEALAKVPDDVLPVVMTTWALSSLNLEERLRFLQRLDEGATRRPVAWVSVEGVGVAPGIPTYGDRRASGHSIIGVSVFEHASLYATAVGRCWLRGEMLAWLSGTRPPAKR